MKLEKFWSIIEATLKAEAETDVQLELLRTQLRALSTDELVAFENTFNDLRLKAYDWRVWGAVYVLHGGASDDGFEYFMRWLISKGQGVFDPVVADPDSLADILADDPDGPCEFEEFAYVASEVWQEKTGVNPWEDPEGRFPYTGASPAEDPRGTPFEDSEPYLSKQYPKLWKRFGKNPLG
jgi:hypothetical protein